MAKTIDQMIEEAKAYLRRLEKNRHKDEPLNRRAYADARFLSSVISLIEFGNPYIKKRAEITLKQIWN